MNQLIQLAIALTKVFTGGEIKVVTFPNAVQVIVNGDVYCWNDHQGWFRPGGDYAPRKVSEELQSRLNNAVIHRVSTQSAAKQQQQPAPAQPAKQATTTKSYRSAESCDRCGGKGHRPDLWDRDGGKCWWCQGTGDQKQGSILRKKAKRRYL